MRKNLALLVAIVVAVCLIGGGVYVISQVNNDRLIVGGKTFMAEFRRTDAEKQRGLSGRDTYPNNRAMVFEFTEAAERCFWMKDMNIAIDIVWLDATKRIVAIEKNVSPDTYPKNFCHGNAQYVIEFAAGTADAVNMYRGDQVIL